MRGEAINKLVDLIRLGVPLDDAHCVAYNQMIPIPPDDGLFVAVGILDSKPYAASLAWKDTSAPDPSSPTGEIVPALSEKQSVNVREVFSIHIQSKNNDARRLRMRVKFALTGIRAAQFQDRDGFLIGKIPIGFADASITEGAERLNRYVITVACLSAEAEEQAIDYFDNYKGSPKLVTQA